MINVNFNFESLCNKDKTEHFRQILLKAARNGERIYQNAFNRINNLPCVRESKGNVPLREIFSEYWDIFYTYYNSIGKIRPVIKENVEALIHCKDFSKEFLTYECPNCNNTINIGLSCNSRFCPSCGNRYREERTLSISKKVISRPHRQFVFSIAEELRSFFVEPADKDALLDILFDSVTDAFNLLVKKSKKAKKENRQFGYILFIHTFGRDLKWNPHIHALICEGYIGNDNNFHKFPYFAYKILRISFMNSLHNRMNACMKKNKSEEFADNFLKSTKYLKKKYPDGYYAYGPKLKENNNRVTIKNLTTYIARYASHHAIAESRILKLDFKNISIKYYFDPYEDDLLDEDDPNRLGRQYVEESIFIFMKKTVRHIPNKGFHNIRHCGFYSRNSNVDLSKFKTLYTENELKKNEIKY